MIFAWLIHKSKAFFLFVVNAIRRAMCCFRKRRRSYSETEQLTHVISNSDLRSNGSETCWSEWNDDTAFNQPKTVQDYIEQYREQAVKARTGNVDDEDTEEPVNFFEDMTPQITRQMKILVKTRADNGGSKRSSSGSRLNVIDETVGIMPSGELGEWEETSGWDGEQLLDREAQQVLREQKRLERERKAWEQQQKRLERTSRTLGSKLAT